MPVGLGVGDLVVFGVDDVAFVLNTLMSPVVHLAQIVLSIGMTLIGRLPEFADVLGTTRCALSIGADSKN